jgi:hypothetical protein
MAKRTSRAVAEPPAPLKDLRIIVDATVAVPTYYVNYMEVANSVHDFTLFGVKMPPKLSADKLAAAQQTKELHVEPEVLITIPATMVLGLIRALTTQKDTYEKLIGKIQEPGGSNE